MISYFISFSFSKNQQTVKEFCDQALAGQSVGMFSAPKLRRLMEDESLRELVCSKLNLGLEVKLSEDEFVKEVVCLLIANQGS